MGRKIKKNFKKKILKTIFIFLLISGLSCVGVFLYIDNKNVIDKMSYENIKYNKNEISFTITNVYNEVNCAVIPVNQELKDIKWKKVEEGICTYKIESNNNYDIYLKVKDETKKITKEPYLLDLELDKTKYYLALKDTQQINYEITSIGEIKKVDITSEKNNIVNIKNNKITGKTKGTTKITLSKDNIKKEITATVTNLIVKKPKQYDFSKKYLSCNLFTKAEEKLLDKILLDRVQTAGEKTRAGVVAAGRFLTLEFPYRISYFSENGRMGDDGSPYADGEGRFIHRGLYLTSNKYEELEKINMGPKPWGCSMHSIPAGGQRKNGLDCSGFTTWVVKNGGFDIEDVGARGKDKEAFDLNTYGEEKNLTKKLALSDEIKAGDLLGEVTVSEGHSAIVIGIDENYYYVAESLWIAPLGVNVNKYKKSELHKYFESVNLMDSYYKDDGNYTAMWY